MSISEQVKELRKISQQYPVNIDIDLFDRILNEAADTIEALSAKLADMERSAEDCGGKWIYCGDGENLPKEPFACIATVIDTDPMTMTDFEAILPYQVGYSGGTWNDSDGRQIPFDVIAWMKAPTEPYHEPNKSITHGKEHRKPYWGAKSIDHTCQNNRGKQICI